MYRAGILGNIMTNPAELDPRQISTLIAIMKALRTPVTGCPWDLEQDFASIAPYTIEEAYEVADAIAKGDRKALADELGDLLLQVVYHAQMAEEEGSFRFADEVEAVTTKMIRRHPHVFGDDEARSAGVAKGFWEANKAKERPKASGVLDGVTVGLPGLTRAVKLQARAARVGFDWPDSSFVIDKIEEEIAELRAAGREEQARHLEVDPEAALRATNGKFERRFRFIEAALAKRGKTPADSDLAEMDGLWDEAKKAGL